MTDTSLTLNRTFASSPDKVWRCMVEPDLLRQWFVPDPVTIKDLTVDPTPGGIFHLVMEVPDMGEMDAGAGCYLVAEPERRLAWTTALLPGFIPAGPAAEDGFHFTAIIDLTPTNDGGTQYTVTALHENAAGCDAHAALGFAEGWGITADQLGRLAATL